MAFENSIARCGLKLGIPLVEKSIFRKRSVADVTANDDTSFLEYIYTICWNLIFLSMCVEKVGLDQPIESKRRYCHIR